jgi:hypothetical protein
MYYYGSLFMYKDKNLTAFEAEVLYKFVSDTLTISLNVDGAIKTDAIYTEKIYQNNKEIIFNDKTIFEAPATAGKITTQTSGGRRNLSVDTVKVNSITNIENNTILYTITDGQLPPGLSLDLDGEIIDDFEQIDHSKMIDNNDYISSANFEIAEQNGSSTSSHSVPEDSITNTIHNLKSGDYLLLVNDVIICSGDSEYIQKQACDLVFGEHELCEGNPIALEDISIIKKVNIKVGLFLE